MKVIRKNLQQLALRLSGVASKYTLIICLLTGCTQTPDESFNKCMKSHVWECKTKKECGKEVSKQIRVCRAENVGVTGSTVYAAMNKYYPDMRVTK
jgi:hypothetical protein